MPGYERARIVGTSDEDIDEFVCGICLQILIKPTVTECCGQTYCYGCISRWVSANNTCPNDRTVLSLNQLKGSPKMVTNLLNKMKIKCDFESIGCESVVRMDQLEAHKEGECLFNPCRKCSKCALYIQGHSDKLCSDKLFEKLMALTTEVEKLRDYEYLNEVKDATIAMKDRMIQSLLAKIECLEYQRQQSGIKMVGDIDVRLKELRDQFFANYYEVTANSEVANSITNNRLMNVFNQIN